MPMVDAVVESVADWLEFRPSCAHEFLFTTRLGNPLHKDELQKILRRALGEARIDRKGITLHSLRHTFASLLLQGGADLVSIQQLLGHTSIESTSMYLHVNTDSLRAAVGKHPLANRNADHEVLRR